MSAYTLLAISFRVIRIAQLLYLILTYIASCADGFKLSIDELQQIALIYRNLLGS